MLRLKSFIKESRSVDGAASTPIKEGDVPPQARSNWPFAFTPHSGFCTLVLAYMSDSLVRVSRRVSEGHFLSISTTHESTLTQGSRSTGTTCCPNKRYQPSARRPAKMRAVHSSAQHMVSVQDCRSLPRACIPRSKLMLSY